MELISEIWNIGILGKAFFIAVGLSVVLFFVFIRY